MGAGVFLYTQSAAKLAPFIDNVAIDNGTHAKGIARDISILSGKIVMVRQ